MRKIVTCKCFTQKIIYRHERFHTEKKPVDAYMAKTKTHNTVKTHIK